MGRVIVMQEEQLKTLGKFRHTIFNANVPQNNANVISDAFSAPQSTQETIGAMPSAPLVDMDGKTNMDVDVKNAAIVDNGVTAQIFGATPTNAVNPVLNDNSSISSNINATSGMLSGDVPTLTNSQVNDLPYKEPSMIMNDSNSETNALDADDYVKDINVLRDKLTAFYNEINSELDKIQERVVQKSGVELVDSAKTSQAINANSVENVGPKLNINNNIYDMSSEQSVPVQTNYDETMVIPRDVMDSAISEGLRVA